MVKLKLCIQELLLFKRLIKLLERTRKLIIAARLVLHEIISKNQKLSKIHFPKIDEILVFERNGGPDGIKTKSPGKTNLGIFVEPYGDLAPDSKLC